MQVFLAEEAPEFDYLPQPTMPVFPVLDMGPVVVAASLMAHH
jgi:hypothetical protein